MVADVISCENVMAPQVFNDSSCYAEWQIVMPNSKTKSISG